MRPRRRTRIVGALPTWRVAAIGALPLAWLALTPPMATAAAAQEEAVAEDPAAELARKLANPISSLISLPIQNNFDFGAGSGGDGFKYTANIQPVIPVRLNEDWNIISRTILPFVHQADVFGTGSPQTGLADTLQSLFFSPQEPAKGGWIWGAGPVLLLPTATDALLGSEKWGAGPTAVVLRQASGWTFGVLANHIWSFAGDDGRQDVNATFLQPFLSYTTRQQTTFSVNTESTYDWENGGWSAPINLGIAQLVKIGGAPVQIQLGARYYAETPVNGPEWGLRFAVTLLWPK